jgi:hypothetical protein
MDNFNLRKYLAEGKLNENMFDVGTTEKIAQAVADAFTIEDNELDLKYVVNPRIDAGSFDLDVEAGPNTPDQDSLGQDIDNYLGEFAGGSFYIKDGVVYNAAMRNAPVANVTPEGEVEMISAEDSRAAIGMEENKNKLKSNKMKKSELKEMIKSAFLNEKETFDQAFDRIDKEEEVYPGEKTVKEADLNIKDETNMYDPVAEQEDVEVEDDENVDVNVEKDVEVDVDDESTETDTVVKTELPGEDAEVTKTLGLLTKAQETAKALGDDKLTDQIGNTITYFTRAHVARQQTNEVKVNEVTFPMWSKINK